MMTFGLRTVRFRFTNCHQRPVPTRRLCSGQTPESASGRRSWRRFASVSCCSTTTRRSRDQLWANGASHRIVYQDARIKDRMVRAGGIAETLHHWLIRLIPVCCTNIDVSRRVSRRWHGDAVGFVVKNFRVVLHPRFTSCQRLLQGISGGAEAVVAEK